MIVSIFIGLIFISSSTIFAQNHVDNEGLKQGEWVKYKNGSKFYEGQFIDDKPIGEFLYFYPNGNIKIRTLFHEDGKMNKTKIFFMR